MANLRESLKELDELIQEKRPRTMDEMINLVHGSGLVNDYGTSFHIVQFMGYVQGVKVGVTGRTKTHYLPRTGSYGVFNGLEKYFKAGWKMEYIGDLQ